MSKKALAKLFGVESQQSGGSPSFMSQTLSKDPQSVSNDNDGGDGGRIPVEEWLPITESRKGNVYTATFHLLCSELGFQVLLLLAVFLSTGMHGNKHGSGSKRWERGGYGTLETALSFQGGQ
ncbi:unnamed protein product [Brassica oleracea var. botrytis]|uniref:(rape) hypothetical protein n=1 Tax=Brassica napus TaxID=3708 RepID=A0A078FX17_BRANA|nr:unnamed protein product [Brassica napus]CDY17516.1 BnaC03g65470D [Brassica napus]